MRKLLDRSDGILESLLVWRILITSSRSRGNKNAGDIDIERAKILQCLSWFCLISRILCSLVIARRAKSYASQAGISSDLTEQQKPTSSIQHEPPFLTSG